MHKRISILLLITLLTVPMTAQRMRDIFKQMPSDIFTYLSNNNRLDFIDFKDANMKAEATNNLGGKSEMTELTEDFTEVKLSESSDFQLKLLPMDSVKIICMVTTCYGPEADSKIEFYTSDWHLLNMKVNMPSFDSFFVKPDSISTERFEQLKKTVEPVMFSARLSSKDNMLTFSLSKPLLGKDDRKALATVLRSITLRWNGKSFQ